MRSLARFDVVVMGAGPAGYLEALRLTQLGKSVAVVEKDRVGGKCLIWECIPSRVLIEVADEMERARRLGAIRA